MRTALTVAVAAVVWAVVVAKARAFRRNPNNAPLLAFCANAGCIATAFTVMIPPLLWRIEHATGVLAIWAIGVIAIGCSAAQTNLLVWTYDKPWPRIFRRWALSGVSLIAMVALTVNGRIDTNTVDVAAYAQQPEILWAQTPYVSDAVLILMALEAYTAVDASRMFWRYAGLVDRRWQRRGLRTTAAGTVIVLVYCLANVAAFLSLRRGGTPSAAHAMPIAVGALGILVCAVGLTMPAWGPLLDRMRAYRRLTPLWKALTRASPEVVLEPIARLPLDRWAFWNIDFRLYRRVIEIRDSSLALRAHRDESVEVKARELAQQAGLAGDELNATVEAAVLAAAIEQKATGRPAAAAATPAGQDCRDLAMEVSWLSHVAIGFTDSPVVRQFSSRTDL